MQEPLTFLNGNMFRGGLAIPPDDAGFVLGVTVSEQLRTFQGRLFKVEDHFARLKRSLEIAGTTIDPAYSTANLAAAAEELAAANHKLIDPADDLGLSIFITPGVHPSLVPRGAWREPIIGMTTFPLAFHLWARGFEFGEHLVTSTVRQVPTSCWPAELKCRSRMHYHLAEQEVRRRNPGARALLLDQHGFVNETSTANVLGVARSQRADTFRIPPRERTLPGVSLAMVQTLTMRVFGSGEFEECELASAEFAVHMSEIMLTSTPFCLLPVVKLDDAPIGDGKPGPVFKKLLAAWSEEVGVDIAEQARRFANR